MQREEKQIEQTLDAVASRLQSLRMTIGDMIHKLDNEHESATMTWPTFLDNFALISSHLTSIRKVLSKDNCQPLRNRTVLPLMLSMGRDESLVNLTEGRVPMFSHDTVPDYLRTKPDPIMEQKMLQNDQKATSLTAEAAMKQVTQYNKVVSHVLDMVSKAREDWEIETSSRAGAPQSSSMADTHALVAAVGMGKGLKLSMPMSGGGMVAVPPNMLPIGPGMISPRVSTPMSSGSPIGASQIGKAPSAIKTNIKSGLQVHPFSR